MMEPTIQTCVCYVTLKTCCYVIDCSITGFGKNFQVWCVVVCGGSYSYSWATNIDSGSYTGGAFWLDIYIF